MNTSDKAVDAIAAWEGLRLRAYRCPAKVLTIGYGHTKGVKEGDTCTKEQALAWLKEDLKEAEGYVSRYFEAVQLTQGQFDASVSFCFNAGVGNMRKSTWAKLLKEGKVAEASIALAQWGNKQFKDMPGLKARRNTESIWLKGATS